MNPLLSRHFASAVESDPQRVDATGPQAAVERPTLERGALSCCFVDHARKKHDGMFHSAQIEIRAAAMLAARPADKPPPLPRLGQILSLTRSIFDSGG